jgi:hypothetical protein
MKRYDPYLGMWRELGIFPPEKLLCPQFFGLSTLVCRFRFPRQNVREYLLINRGTSFFAVVFFGSTHIPSVSSTGDTQED